MAIYQQPKKQTRNWIVIMLQLVLLLQPLLQLQVVVVAAVDECNSDRFCQTEWSESKCINGKCTNPFASGCLFAMEEKKRRRRRRSLATKDEENTVERKLNPHHWFEKRVCNSNDDKDSEYCQESIWKYPEVVIHNADWESVIFYSWIMQIFLMEFLQVPTRIGLGNDSSDASFYNIENLVPYSSESYPWDAIQKANELQGDCSATEEPCVHVFPEVWAGQEKKWKQMVADGEIDNVDGGGMVGKISWYVPHYTVQEHPEFASYHGMVNNSEKLAEVFKRPTSWKEYCDEISISTCITPDGVAEHYPTTKDEENMYFKEGSFTGHFRYTSQNNCTLNRDTCTGHIVGGPCEWTTYIDAQTYWLDIALESNGPEIPNGGYLYPQMVQIYKAAVKTRSDIIMWWWNPEVTTELFRGTDAELQTIALPKPTTECRRNRIQPEDRCHPDIEVRRGQAEGVCDLEAHILRTIIASSLRDSTNREDEVSRSPGYQAIKNIKLDGLDMVQLLSEWARRGQTGFAAREVVCEYVVDNIDELSTMIPLGYPRIDASDDSEYSGALFTVGTIVAALVLIYIILIIIGVYYYRKATVFVYAQIAFVKMVLFGFVLVGIAAILYTLEPSTGVCASQVWFELLGYTFFMVPLIVKISAINRLMTSSKKMKRIKISHGSLYAKVAVWVMIVTCFLIAYQAVDPPTSVYYQYLEAVEPPSIQDTVQTSNACAADSWVWAYCIYAFEFLLIIFAFVLAFQSRSTKSEFNESGSLSAMVYSHFFFVSLRTLMFIFYETNDDVANNSLAPASISGITSILLSLDVFFSATIYVIPKLRRAQGGNDEEHKSRSSKTGKSIQSTGRFRGSNYVQEIQKAASYHTQQYQRQSDFDQPTSIDFNKQKPGELPPCPGTTGLTRQIAGDSLPSVQPSTSLRRHQTEDENDATEFSSFRTCMGELSVEGQEQGDESGLDELTPPERHISILINNATEIRKEIPPSLAQEEILKDLQKNRILVSHLSQQNKPSTSPTNDHQESQHLPKSHQEQQQPSQKRPQRRSAKQSVMQNPAAQGLFALKRHVGQVIIANILADGAEIEYDSSSDDSDSEEEEHRRRPSAEALRKRNKRQASGGLNSMFESSTDLTEQRQNAMMMQGSQNRSFVLPPRPVGNSSLRRYVSESSIQKQGSDIALTRLPEDQEEDAESQGGGKEEAEASDATSKN